MGGVWGSRALRVSLGKKREAVCLPFLIPASMGGVWGSRVLRVSGGCSDGKS